MSISEQLNKIIAKKDIQMQAIADKVCKKTADKLREILYECWYATYTPTVYKRSFDFINSITGEVVKNKRGNYSINVFFDEDKINVVEQSGGWNSHMGFNGERFIEGLIYSIDSGMRGSLSNPRYGESTDMIRLTKEWANQYARQQLRQIL